MICETGGSYYITVKLKNARTRFPIFNLVRTEIKKDEDFKIVAKELIQMALDYPESHRLHGNFKQEDFCWGIYEKKTAKKHEMLFDGEIYFSIVCSSEEEFFKWFGEEVFLED